MGWGWGAAFLTRWFQLTIAAPVHRALAKDHDVLGEGSRLVREDVFHLPKLLVQRGSACLSWRAALPAVHPLVPVDKIAVPQTDHFHTAGKERER